MSNNNFLYHFFDKVKAFIVKALKIVIRRTIVIDNVKNSNPSIVAIVSPYFRGVRSATVGMVDDVIEVSNVYTNRRANKIAHLILKYQPDRILISGYALGHDKLVERIKHINPNVRIFVLIHSSFIWFDTFPNENTVFKRFCELSKAGVIEKLGFGKKDLAEYFKLRGYDTYYVMNRFHIDEHEFRSLDNNHINIGIFGNNLWYRNITNQTIAATMLDNTTVHVNEISDHFFLDKNRIIEHGIMPKDDFLKLYSNIDINMYISLTDCFPMTVIESMQYGIPCLVSDTSGVYAFSGKLKKWLTVSTIDGPIGINQKLQEVIDNYAKIQAEIKRYLPILEKHVEESIRTFLS